MCEAIVEVFNGCEDLGSVTVAEFAYKVLRKLGFR